MSLFLYEVEAGGRGDGRDRGWVGGPAGDGLEYGSEALCDSFSRVFIFLCFPWLNRTVFTYGFLRFSSAPVTSMVLSWFFK